MGIKRNFSLSIWDHEDNFLCNLKSVNMDFEGQSFNENFIENINGEKTLTFSIPMYVFDINGSEKVEKTTEKKYFKQNEAWRYIFNEQKIRYIEYSNETSAPIRTEEFIIKNFTENRQNEEKIVECECESLAVHELGKIGWNINFDVDYIKSYESSSTSNPDYNNLLTLDYWMEKILYWESNLGIVSNTTECTKLLKGLQLRDDEGYPISSVYIVNSEGEKLYDRIDEPICTLTQNKLEESSYYNPTGWTWEVQSIYKNNPAVESLTTNLYESPVIDRYIQITKDNYIGLSYQKEVGTNNEPRLLRHPIAEKDYGTYEYVTSIKKRLFSTERSNIYSIIQDLCETFEVWANFVYEYDDSGKIVKRKIIFKTDAINEDAEFDFSYGKNLQGCARNADSNELVTKLIVTDTESQVADGNILSIKRATANPTGEGYLYNFDYYYNLGTLSKYTDDEKEGRSTSLEHSDEYKINHYYGQLKEYNQKISNLQNYLTPLYDRKMSLEGDLSIQEGSLNGYMENIQSIQEKIDAIPSDSRIIKSWAEDSKQNNHVGEVKTFSTTTKGTKTYRYIDFGRDDVLCNNDIEVNLSRLEESVDGYKVVIDTNTSITTSKFVPRMFTYNSWSTGITISDNTTGNYFRIISNSTTGTSTLVLQDVEYVYSELGNNQFIKGIYFNFHTNTNNINTYGRIRYKYAPLAYYYLLMQDYWNKIIKVEEDINNIKADLKEINNRIITNELELSNILNDKKKLIYQFEKEYKSYIKEGYWEPSDYQSQINFKTIDTSSMGNSVYEGLVQENHYLSELNLNNSLNNYTYYVDLGILASQIDIDSIKIKTKNPTFGDGTVMPVPRYRGNDYEVFINPNGRVIIGVSPSLVDSYKLHDYDNKYYKFFIDYSGKNSTTVNSVEKNWILINDNSNNPQINERFIYVSNDNILIESLELYGIQNNDNERELIKDEDYTCLFDYAGYDNQGHRIALNNQESYSTDIFYDYMVKITLKNTNNVNDINRFKVKYTEETTLDFLYNDAVSMSKEYASPKVTYNVSVLDISRLNQFENYKPRLGQKVPIWDVEMGLNGYDGFITSISRELENPSNTQIEITTYETRFEDLFQKLTATMTDIRYNENRLYTAMDSFNTDGTIKTQVFQKSMEDNSIRIAMGTDNDITISESTGITLKDRNSNNAVKLIGNGIFLTENYNMNPIPWKTGITGEGINANAIAIGAIDTKKITIWNSSEDKYRFMWNEEGLFAYGDELGKATSTPIDLIDYDKYVKLNQNGLKFNDHGRSALTLGWTGLQLETQQGALKLDADNGLILKNGSTTRLELGKLDNGSLYGLRLTANNGDITFQNDSNGDLWLHRHIRLGGEINNNNVVNNPTAGIYGLSTDVPLEMQMGLRRTDKGEIIWDSNPIRFWAGPQTTTDYKNKIHITDDNINDSSTSTNIINNLKNISDKSPTLSKFKVSANGDIVASGIDVGGWIGEGDKLHSSDNQAILRSNGYDETTSGNNYPVIAIGKPNSNADTNYGSNYNFRVTQDGSVSILKSGSGYYTGIQSATTSNSVVFYTGTQSDPAKADFRVLADGTVNASKLKIEKSAVNGLTTDISNLLTKINSTSSTVDKIISLDSSSGLTIVSTIGSLSTNVTNIANLSDTSLSIVQSVNSAKNRTDILTDTYITNIAAGEVALSISTIGGFTNTNDSTGGLTKQTGSYYVGMCVPQSTNNIVFYAGTSGKANDNNAFWVKADGSVKVSDITITGNNTNNNLINAGNGNFTVSQNGSVTANDITITGKNTNNNLINAGNGKFTVSQNGSVTASNITITGGNGNWIINSSYFQVDNDGQIGAGHSSNSFDGEYYPFSVDRFGTIRFQGTIWAKSGNTWYKGVETKNIKIMDSTNTYRTIKVIDGLIVGEER